MSGTLSAEGTFSSSDAHVRPVLDVLLEHVPHDAALRILDIGAGTGDGPLALLAERPAVTVTALDLSEENVRILRRRLEGHPDAARIDVVHGDVLEAAFGAPFDLVVANQSLHLVEGSTPRLVERVAAAVRPGGLLLSEMPYQDPYNTALIALRRVMGRLRGPAFERAALRVARLLHRGELDPEQLRERLVYLYIIPPRLSSPQLDAQLAAEGLDLVDRRAMRQASPAQLRHHLSVYRKRA